MQLQPNRFLGLISNCNPKISILIFKSGKIVCTGAKHIEDVKRESKKVFEGFDVNMNDAEFKIQNIVVSADLNSKLNLDVIAIGVGLENIEYEPEQFPGLVYHLFKSQSYCSYIQLQENW